jgi:predicted nucleic acid-binding protein
MACCFGKLLASTLPLAAGVKRLYTEDFSGYGRIEGIEMVNPFTP